jgi:nonsense-mediated mRNA decay protein 3
MLIQDIISATFLYAFLNERDMERHTQYFEGVLQLRNVSQDMVEFVLSQFEKNKVGIADILELKNGLDIYSASNKFSRKIAKKLVNEFGGEIKENPRLFSKSRLTSRNIYRLNVLYKAPEIRKGEVIAFRDRIIKVSSLSKNLVKGIDLVSGSRVAADGKSVRKLKLMKAVVISIKPRIQIMHPETYQPVVAENTRKVWIDQEVSFVSHKGKTYLL